MNRTKSQWLIVCLSILVYISSLFSFTYAAMTLHGTKDLPFGLHATYRHFQSASHFPLTFADIAPAGWDEQLPARITLISVKHNLLGLYDPALYFSRDLHYIQPGMLRGFSDTDYRAGNKVAYYMLENPSDIPDLVRAQVNAPEGLKIINGLGEDSGLYTEQTDYVVNMTSMEDIGNEVYLEGEREEVLMWSKGLEKQGFQLADKGKTALSDALVVFLSRFNRVSIFLYLSVLLYFLLFISIAMTELSAAGYVRMHHVFGGQGVSLFRVLHRELIFSVLLTALSFMSFFFIGRARGMFEYIELSGFVGYTFGHLAVVAGCPLFFHRVSLKLLQRRTQS